MLPLCSLGSESRPFSITDELPQIVVLLLESLVLRTDGFLLLLCLHDTCLVLFLLLAKLRDLALQLSHQLVFVAYHVGNSFL